MTEGMAAGENQTEAIVLDFAIQSLSQADKGRYCC
jgi:hypothetical protein